MDDERPSASDRRLSGTEAPLILDLDGFEGPIDVLLELARGQKVDLARISILALAEQYLAFIAAARERDLDLAADYLVMAAWLAYLKSRLLLPAAAGDQEPTGEEMAAALKHRLERLAAMREAAERLFARPLLGREVFPRGMVEPAPEGERRTFEATLSDLIAAYVAYRRRKDRPERLAIEPFVLYSLDDALARLARLVGRVPGWSTLAEHLPEGVADPLTRRSAVAAHLVAALELARLGRLELRQDGGPFSPIHLRACAGVVPTNEALP